ncbi:MAG: hypothetical protein KatS3mg125_1078 [Lysobacterales bacterium]|jgi:hypothetical protein|nr:MAG: hypothetical protein KatS3mg125_1078 [Xanthomonadales bacterium]
MGTDDRELLEAVRATLSRRAGELDASTRARLAAARRRALEAHRAPRLVGWWPALPALAAALALLVFKAPRPPEPAPPVRAETFALLGEPEGAELLELAEFYRLLDEETSDVPPPS